MFIYLPFSTINLVLADAEVTSADMVDGVDPTSSEGMVTACVDEVECTEDDSVDGHMEVCNSSSGVVLARPSAWDSVPPRRPPCPLPRPPLHLTLDLACLQ